MIYFVGLKSDVQKGIISEWIRLSQVFKMQFKNKCYVLPVLQDESSIVNPRMICIHTICAILGVGRRKLHEAKNKQVFRHAFKDRTGDETNRGIISLKWKPSLIEFFEKLKGEGVPFATRAVREETGTTLRDDNPDDVALPPHVTKRQCYARWCYEQGWIVKLINRSMGRYARTDQYDLRSNDDEAIVPLWPSGSVPNPICAWPTFLQFWHTKYKNIKVSCYS